MQEIWKDIVGYEGLYQVSNLGNVKSLNYGKKGYEKMIATKENSCGRLWVMLYKSGNAKPMQVHRLVGEAFIENPNKYPQINHKDENPKNNKVDNLEWCTASYNIKYSMDRHPERYEKLRNTTTNRKGKLKGLKINQISFDGHIEKEWQNSNTVKIETGWSSSSITRCCRGERKTAYGFKWQYAI